MYQDKMGLIKKAKNKVKKKVNDISKRFTIDYGNEQIDTLNRTQGTNVPFLNRGSMKLKDARTRRQKNRQRFFRGN